MNSQLRKNLLFNTAGSLLFYLCQAALNLLVTALAGVAANGMLATAMTIANVCLSVASFGMRTFQVSDLEGKYADRTYLLSRYVTLTAAGAGCLAFAFVNSYSAEQRWVIALYTAYRLIESWSDVWHGYLQKAERLDVVGISFGVRGLVTAGTVTLGLVLTGNLVITLAALFVLNAVYVLAVDLPLAQKHAAFATRGGGSVWALLAECAPLAVYAALNTAIPSVPRYFCERVLGTVKMSYFNNVFLPVLILQVAVIYLFVPFITTFARLWNQKDKAGFSVALCCWRRRWPPCGPPGPPGWRCWGGGAFPSSTPPARKFWTTRLFCSRWCWPPSAPWPPPCCATCSPSPGTCAASFWAIWRALPPRRR